MDIKRIWSMPNKWTFKIKPIKDLLEKYKVGKGWVDPFAGMNSPAEFTNDINPNTPTSHHLKANDFLNQISGEYSGILFDPPYNLAQLKECYQSYGYELMKNDINYTYSLPKDIAYTKIKIGGVAISFGWNSVGFGKQRGFRIIEVLLVCHGGHHNDTIVTVEKKIQSQGVLNI